MRAATASGMIFVGPAMGGGTGMPGGQSNEEPFKPNVIAPNPEVQKARNEFQKALAEKRSFWLKEVEEWGLDNLSGSLIELLERMNIRN